MSYLAYHPDECDIICCVDNREAGSVCFTLDVSDSDNITSDRGVLVVDCPIAPGHFKVMLHVAPMDDANSWTCGLFCKATTIPDLDDLPPAP